MLVLFWAFSLFHLCMSMASLGLAVRLLTPDERALWRSKAALLVASLTCWLYAPIAGFSGWSAWSAFQAGGPYALPLLLTPFLWLLLMGVVFALVDFLEDGILGNARSPET